MSNVGGMFLSIRGFQRYISFEMAWNRVGSNTCRVLNFLNGLDRFDMNTLSGCDGFNYRGLFDCRM